MEYEYNALLLFFNALIWIFTFYWYLHKHQRIGIGSLLILSYAILSIISIHLFFNSEAVGMFQNLSFIPFVYLYLMILLAISPILSMERKKILNIQQPNKYLLNLVCMIIIILSLQNIGEVIGNIKKGIVMLIIDSDYGREAYQEMSSTINSIGKSNKGFDFLSIFANSARYISLPFLGYYLTLSSSNKIILIGLAVSSLITPLYGISIGSRFEIGLFLINTLFLFTFIFKFLPKKLKGKIKICLVSIFILLIIPFAMVTISRGTGEIDRITFSLERYVAESILNFNNYGLDANGCRYGDRTAVLLKEICGLKPARDYAERRLKYSDMKMDESVFYTFVGDFTLDYGPWISVFIFIGTAIFFNKMLRVRNNCLQFYQYLFLYLLLVGCVGFFQYPLADRGGNIRLFSLLLLAFLFKFDYKRQKTAKHIK